MGEIYRHLQERCEGQIGNEETHSHTVTDVHVTLSSPSNAEWREITTNIVATLYIDFKRIRKVDEYVYYWTLQDYLRPNKFGHLSNKIYNQGDCKLFRYKNLSLSTHREPMGKGFGRRIDPKVMKSWIYPAPRSGDELILKTVCALKK